MIPKGLADAIAKLGCFASPTQRSTNNNASQPGLKSGAGVNYGSPQQSVGNSITICERPCVVKRQETTGTSANVIAPNDYVMAKPNPRRRYLKVTTPSSNPGPLLLRPMDGFGSGGYVLNPGDSAELTEQTNQQMVHAGWLICGCLLSNGVAYSIETSWDY